jgi:hypothetical protein
MPKVPNLEEFSEPMANKPHRDTERLAGQQSFQCGCGDAI